MDTNGCCELPKEKTAKAKIVLVPACDIYEQDNKIVLEADMPRVDEKSVDLNLEKNILTIVGHAEIPGKDPNEASPQGYDYRKVFKIAGEVNSDQITATMKNGVLTVVLPRLEEQKPKKIAVNA